MGNQLTKANCFNLAQLPAAKFQELTSDSYTVLRTSGDEDPGFCIPVVGHYCKQNDAYEPGWQAAHAWDGLNDSKTAAAEQAEGNVHAGPFKKWKVHLVKYGDPSQNCCDVCGWRTMMPDNGVGAYKNQRTFWPTRLTTPEQREAWWLEMDAILNSLKRNADLSPDERAAINAADALRDEEINGPLRQAIAAKTQEFMKEFRLSQGLEDQEAQRVAEAATVAVAAEAKAAAEAAEAAEFTARHAWWAAFDAEHAELKAIIKADKEAEGLSAEQATLFARSVSDDIMGGKQREVLAAIPEGAMKIWPSGVALQVWATHQEKARILAEVKLALPKFSLQDQQKRADYAFENPEYWAQYRSWLNSTTPEERLKQEEAADWALRHG